MTGGWVGERVALPGAGGWSRCLGATSLSTTSLPGQEHGTWVERLPGAVQIRWSAGWVSAWAATCWSGLVVPFLRSGILQVSGAGWVQIVLQFCLGACWWVPLVLLPCLTWAWVSLFSVPVLGLPTDFCHSAITYTCTAAHLQCLGLEATWSLCHWSGVHFLHSGGCLLLPVLFLPACACTICILPFLLSTACRCHFLFWSGSRCWASSGLGWSAVHLVGTCLFCSADLSSIPHFCCYRAVVQV